MVCASLTHAGGSPHSALTARSVLGQLAIAQAKLGQPEQAAESYAEALAQHAARPDEPREEARAANNYGNLRNQQQRYAEAAALYEQAITAYERAGDAEREAARTRTRLAGAFIDLARFDEAEDRCRQAVSVLAERHDDGPRYWTPGTCSPSC